MDDSLVGEVHWDDNPERAIRIRAIISTLQTNHLNGQTGMQSEVIKQVLLAELIKERGMAIQDFLAQLENVLYCQNSDQFE